MFQADVASQVNQLSSLQAWERLVLLELKQLLLVFVEQESPVLLALTLQELASALQDANLMEPWG
ncbi:hypothetical protein D3C83_207210 [compost metagenome]